jgi:hypothetical protein
MEATPISTLKPFSFRVLAKRSEDLYSLNPNSANPHILSLISVKVC